MPCHAMPCHAGLNHELSLAFILNQVHQTAFHLKSTTHNYHEAYKAYGYWLPLDLQVLDRVWSISKECTNCSCKYSSSSSCCCSILFCYYRYRPLVRGSWFDLVGSMAQWPSTNEVLQDLRLKISVSPSVSQ